jgi:molybdopterin-guanine dinucleotide biosynthesis protein A
MISFSAAILAGGKSSRFGEDKALYKYKGKTLLEWVKESLSDADQIFSVSNLDLPITTYQDIYASGYSLCGLHAALHYAKHDWVAVVACDMPFLTPSFWQILLTHTKGTQMVIAENALGDLEPLAALYHRSLLPIVEEHIQAQNFKIKNLVTLAPSRLIPWSMLKTKVNHNLFLNVNTKSDLP